MSCFASLMFLLLLLSPSAALAVDKVPPPPPQVQGSYFGWAQIKEEGKPGPGDKVALKMSLTQFGDRLKGLVTVGQDEKDQIVFEITKGRLEGDKLWLEADEWIWRLKLTGGFADQRFKGKIIIVNKDPAKVLPTGKKPAKKFVPITMRGPVELTRR
jgi:hypothetical protein